MIYSLFKVIYFLTAQSAVHAVTTAANVTEEYCEESDPYYFLSQDCQSAVLTVEDETTGVSRNATVRMDNDVIVKCLKSPCR